MVFIQGRDWPAHSIRRSTSAKELLSLPTDALDNAFKDLTITVPTTWTDKVEDSGNQLDERVISVLEAIKPGRLHDTEQPRLTHFGNQRSRHLTVLFGFKRVLTRQRPDHARTVQQLVSKIDIAGVCRVRQRDFGPVGACWSHIDGHFAIVEQIAGKQSRPGFQPDLRLAAFLADAKKAGVRIKGE